MFDSRAPKAIALSAVVFVFAANTSFSSNQSPQLGSWSLNRAKSDFAGDPGYQSQTMIVTDAGSGMVHYAFDTLDSKGNPMHVEYDTKFDGKPHPILKNDYFDASKYVLQGSHKVTWSIMKDGKPVAWGVDTVSADGKTKNEIENWRHDGKLFTYRLVFDRQ